MSIRAPGFAALADGLGGEAQPAASTTASAVAAVKAATRNRARRRLRLLAGSGNVQHNLEFQQ